MAKRQSNWTIDTIAVLAAFATAPNTRIYGYALAETTGFKLRWVYGWLWRFEARGWIVGERERIDTSAASRPARVFYRITDDGALQYRRLRRAMGMRPDRGRRDALPVRSGSQLSALSLRATTQ